MLIKFFGGTGGGAGIANYLVDPDRAGREGAPPEVLRGDILRTQELIDSTARKWTYTTGVISFAPEDRPTAAQQAALMDDFERLAFAGLEKDQYDITWVRHSHTSGGRVELHFLLPRMELSSGRAFNIAPPGWEGTYAPLRDAYNYAHGWARPDDPDRARTQQHATEGPARAETREAITTYLEGRILAGEVTDRASILSALTEAGFETPRAGKSYITALDPQTGTRWRLTGRIYEQTWTRDAELDRTIAREGGATEKPAVAVDEQRAAQSRERLEAIIQRRADWVRERFAPEAEQDRDRGDEAQTPDRDRHDRDQGQPAPDDRDQHRDRGANGDAVLGRTDAVDDVAAGRGDNRDERNGPLPDPAGDRRTGLALWDAALRQIGGLIDREPDTDRTGAFARIRELGSRIRGFGAAAIGAIRTLFERDRSVGEPSEQARDALEASERSLGTAEQINARLDRASTDLERVVTTKERIAELQHEFERGRKTEMER